LPRFWDVFRVVLNFAASLNMLSVPTNYGTAIQAML
jgi:hypothetical protein